MARASCSAANRREKPQYLIGEKGAKLYVRGTVAGIFTVYSPTDIEIEDDLVYLKDPRQTVISRDFLALISGRDITIAAGEVTGAGRSERARARCSRGGASITEAVDKAKPATMFIYGSLTAGTILGNRAALRDQARLRQTLRIPAPGELSHDAALRGRLLGPGLERGRGS